MSIRIKVSNFFMLLKYPKIFPRLFYNYLLVFFGKNRLRSVEIGMTYRCNLKCKHCSAKHFKKNVKNITLNEYKDGIDQALAEGAIHFLFTGGEPLLNEKLYELVSYVKHRGGLPSLDTNGLIFDSEIADRLIKSGVALIEISIDSADPEMHDSFRGVSGSWDAAMQALEICLQKRLRVVISTVLTKKRLYSHELDRFLDIMAEKGVEVNFCFPCPVGGWKGDYKGMFDKSDWNKVSELRMRKHVRICAENTYLFEGCSAGTEKIGINCQGEVQACPLIPKVYGNIKQDKLKNILFRMRREKEIKNAMRYTCMPSQNREFIQNEEDR